ncbi:uncharacterized protein LOC125499679 isoform X1 [Athalia rosae]|uniref:uncharacterized protein LOC125499679 isoform X1 n=1 Tax=Athalia rosae TaxID=37344 RepID=UPI0020333F91|nr:uncharacterized protein LOC125499679 isoform X1 [Athalia rosae]XP_048514774.1 uncharacterized protein LOC125499679 isoform X1 [Athalia rosae]
METMPDRCRTSAGTCNMKFEKRPHRRRASGSLIPSNTWPSEIREFSSDHNLKPPEGKFSDESVDVAEITEIHYPDFTSCGVRINSCREKSIPLNSLGRGEIGRDNYHTVDNNYNVDNTSTLSQNKIRIDNIPVELESPSSPTQGVAHAVEAEQKLQKLKELQRKRELTERYYSQEIRKLIAEYYKDSKITGDVINRNKETSLAINTGAISPKKACGAAANQGDNKIVSKPIQPTKNNPPGVLKALEPCGTMTTITRLDCGCMQETTRPIFTTSHGRVENRNCRHGRNPAILKLAPSNPQEHLSLSNTETKRRSSQIQNSSSGIKHRPGINCYLPACGKSQDLPKFSRSKNKDNGQDIDQNNARHILRRPGTASSSFIIRNNYHPEGMRNLSPLRKYTDSSTD